MHGWGTLLSFWHLRCFPQHICNNAMQQFTCCDLKLKKAFGYASFTSTGKTKLWAGGKESKEVLEKLLLSVQQSLSGRDCAYANDLHTLYLTSLLIFQSLCDVQSLFKGENASLEKSPSQRFLGIPPFWTLRISISQPSREARYLLCWTEPTNSQGRHGTDIKQQQRSVTLKHSFLSQV